jgi:choline monooxygenase
MNNRASQPLERALEARFYVDPVVFAAERERIFRRSWQIAGHASAWDGTGSFRTVDLGGASVFVVRGEGGELRAFRNACRHRGSPLVQGAGRAPCETIQCPYHGWRYGLDGALLETPWFGEQTPFDLASLSLIPAALDTWRGLVFVALEAEGPLLDQLGEMPALLTETPLEHMVEVDGRPFVEPINWKTYVDQFTEYYHSPAVHGSDERVGIDRFTAKPFRGGMVMRAPDGLAFYGGKWVWTWPNLTISTFAGGVKISRITPLSAQESEIRFLFLADPAADVAPAERQRVIDATFRIFEEDAALLRRVQSSFSSGMFDSPGPLHPRHEEATAYFQRLVREKLA